MYFTQQCTSFINDGVFSLTQESLKRNLFPVSLQQCFSLQGMIHFPRNLFKLNRFSPIVLQQCSSLYKRLIFFSELGKFETKYIHCKMHIIPLKSVVFLSIRRWLAMQLLQIREENGRVAGTQREKACQNYPKTLNHSRSCVTHS